MVDTIEKLAAFLLSVQAVQWMAVDTEADSLHAYPEKVCLIQVTTTCGDRLIDPLAPIDLGPLFEAFSKHELIMHGADYDLRLLRKHHQFVPRSIFDTMIAARLLGVQQFGLGNLVESFLGVKLEKGPQKANWAVRPLTPRMEKYARNDTHYLKPLKDKLQAQLKEMGRLEWHRQSCAQLISDTSTELAPEPDTVWRLKGSQKLDRRGLAILRELWRWREREATVANRPPFFVVSHDTLLMIALNSSQNRPFEPLLPRHLSDRRRAGIDKAVAHAMELSVEHFPKIFRNVSRRLTEADKRRCQELRKRRDARAAELGIDPTLIASRSTLADLAHDWTKYSKELMPWQLALLKSEPAQS